MSFKEKINSERLPCHIAIIMDGNGRWAKEKGEARVFGHQHGVNSVREVVEAAAEVGVEYLTLYAFSTENWHRPLEEVGALMELLVKAISNETPTLMKNDVKLNAFGDLESLPKDCFDELMQAIERTSNNKGLTLSLALSYSSRWELVQMAKRLAKSISQNKLTVDDVSEDLLSSLLCTGDMPDPELLIRTSGEHRISNFMLWQIAYSELYFTDTLWPDFKRENFYEAIVNFQKRERRFGKTSEQVI